MDLKRVCAIGALVLLPGSALAVSSNGQGSVNGNAPTASVSPSVTPTASTTTDGVANSTATSLSGAGNGQSQAENRTQVQTQTNNPGVGAMTEEQVQAEERIQSEIKASKPDYAPKNATALQNRSVVATAAESLVRVANKAENQGIGSQIKTVAQTQSQNQDKIGQALDKAETRTGFAKFFIGANYKELALAKETLDQNREQIKTLTQLMTQLASDPDKVEVANQVIALQQEQIALKEQIGELGSGFSLFGWVARWKNHF